MRRLLIRPGAIGDCLCALPALYLLQGDYTEIWTSGAIAPLVGFGNRVQSLAGTGFSLLGVDGAHPPGELLERLAGFDEILSWTGHNQPLLRERAAKLQLPIHFFPALPEPGDTGHVTDYFLRQTQAWHGLCEEPIPWRQPGGRRFLLNPECLRASPPHKRPLVILHPYSGSSAKNWPLEHFRQIAGLLESQCELRWCASPEDPLPTELAPLAWRHDCLCTLARDLSSAGLYVGNDSGITHLAAMMGVPVVVFFGPMDPQRWAPRGSRIRMVLTPSAGRPASGISFETGRASVLAALREWAMESH
ncbi:MAG: glycosyltransferase family 9 protein [Bryobacterales bacterium]|nr:glycosyltransferase family 9 protein [Bryobacterales bacterium]